MQSSNRETLTQSLLFFPDPHLGLCPLRASCARMCSPSRTTLHQPVVWTIYEGIPNKMKFVEILVLLKRHSEFQPFLELGPCPSYEVFLSSPVHRKICGTFFYLRHARTLLLPYQLPLDFSTIQAVLCLVPRIGASSSFMYIARCEHLSMTDA